VERVLEHQVERGPGLFFGAVSTRLESPTLQAALLSIGAVVFVVATAITISFPVEF
jgi:hypothetical protein